MLKNMVKDISELKIDFDTLLVEYVSDEGLKMALTGIEYIKELLCNY